MNRLQKKCVLVSLGCHSLLLVILFVGPGFLSPRSKPDNLPVLDFVPQKTIDAAFSGGGNPNAAAPPPAPPPPIQPLQPQSTAPPAPPPQPEATRLPEPTLAPAETKRKLPQVSTKIVTIPRRNTAGSSAAQSATGSDDAAHRQQAIGSALNRLRQGLSASTSIDDLYGPGGGGPTYANFLQAVKSDYARAWAGTVPDGATEANTFVTASVTIARDGTVIAARIVRPSGKPLVDASVQAVLDRVKKTVPIPDDSKDKERTVEITFRVNPRNLAG